MSGGGGGGQRRSGQTRGKGTTPPRGQARTSGQTRATGTRGNGGSRQSQNRTFIAALLILLLAGGGLLAYLAEHHTAPKAVAVDPNLPPGSAKGYTLGRPDAPVHIMEFADFECPACANYTVVTEPDVRKRIIDSGLANVTYYDFPLPQHKNTLVASQAAACANDQGKFWEMHDRLFQGQTDWNGEATGSPGKVMRGYAKDLGLDVDKWQQCMDQGTHMRDIQANKAEGERHQVEETPTFVIGNRKIPGAITFDEMHAYVDSARAGAHPPTTASGTGAQPQVHPTATTPNGNGAQPQQGSTANR